MIKFFSYYLKKVVFSTTLLMLLTSLSFSQNDSKVDNDFWKKYYAACIALLTCVPNCNATRKAHLSRCYSHCWHTSVYCRSAPRSNKPKAILKISSDNSTKYCRHPMSIATQRVSPGINIGSKKLITKLMLNLILRIVFHRSI